MRSTRKSSGAAEITPTQRRDEIISILAAGLVRLVQANLPAREKLSESGENGLELSGETRLSVVAGERPEN
jgi:hypothetical protein